AHRRAVDEPRELQLDALREARHGALLRAPRRQGDGLGVSVTVAGASLPGPCPLRERCVVGDVAAHDLGIAGLDEEPLGLRGIRAAGADQRPGAPETLAVQREAQVPRLQGFLGVTVGLPASLVPDPHVAGAVLALRYLTLEAGVVERMVLHLH